MIRGMISLLLGLSLAASALAQEERKIRKKKKNEDKEPITQTLPVLKDPPSAITAETARLTFQVSPLSDKGLLSQQTRDAIKALTQVNKGGTIVKLRAFVAGTGDMRRVQTIVSETFTDRKQPLPALSTIQVGALPMEGAQVVIESISVDKKVVNPKGVVFFSGQRAADAGAAVAQLESAAREAMISAADMLRVTCFLSSLDQVQPARAAVARAFPGAAGNFAQFLRLNTEPAAVCEAAGRGGEAGGPLVRFTGPAGRPNAALIRTQKVVFTGTQMAFRDQDADLKLAFERLGKALEPVGANYRDVVYSNFYPLTRPVEQKIGALLPQFFPAELHPAGTTLIFEGLPSLDATMAVEVVAAH